MKKSLLVMLLALSMAAMMGCGKDKKDKGQDDVKVQEQINEEESADSETEEVEGTEEDSVIDPVLEDSIFDENGNVKDDVGLYEPEGPDDPISSDNKNNQNDKKPQNNNAGKDDKPSSKPTQTPTPTPEAPKPTTPPSGDSGSTGSGDGEMNYESFQTMSPSDQQAYMESFGDLDQFFDWYNAEKEKYEKEHPSIEVNGGSIDLDKIVNGN